MITEKEVKKTRTNLAPSAATSISYLHCHENVFDREFRQCQYEIKLKRHGSQLSAHIIGCNSMSIPGVPKEAGLSNILLKLHQIEN